MTPTTPSTSFDAHFNLGGRVMAAVDASGYADSIAAHAAWAAQRLVAPLEFVHVLDRQDAPSPTPDYSGNLAIDTHDQLLHDLALADAQRGRLAMERGRILLELAARTAADAGQADAGIRLRHGSLVDTLAGLEADVRLFVMGKRGEHADFARGHLGSQLERVVRAVHRPLLVASRAFRAVLRVLVAFDGSATTRKCVEMVAGSPLFAGLPVTVVMAGDATGERREALDWALRTLAVDGRPAPTGAIRTGDAEDVIADAVRDDAIDLLVMGAYGHSRIRQLIVGSTTSTMLRTCQIPVLLLR